MCRHSSLLLTTGFKLLFLTVLENNSLVHIIDNMKKIIGHCLEIEETKEYCYGNYGQILAKLG